MRILSGRVSYANVTATLALVVALGGTSYAAVALPKNSVGSTQIKKNAVKSSDVKNGALKGIDFAAGQIPAGPSGPSGPSGPAGPAGATGPTGAAGVSAFKAFARIQFAAGVPSVAFSTPGITITDVGIGRVDVTFPAPVNEDTCAFLAMADTNGAVGVIRKSTVFSDGALIGLQIVDMAGASTDISFNVVAVC